MAFNETRKLIKEHCSSWHNFMAFVSLGVIICGYWLLLRLLGEITPFSSFLNSGWFKLFFQTLPIAIITVSNLLKQGAYINALKNDWLGLSTQTYIVISLIIILSIVLLKVFILKINQNLNKINEPTLT